MSVPETARRNALLSLAQLRAAQGKGGLEYAAAVGKAREVLVAVNETLRGASAPSSVHVELSTLRSELRGELRRAAAVLEQSHSGPSSRRGLDDDAEALRALTRTRRQLQGEMQKMAAAVSDVAAGGDRLRRVETALVDTDGGLQHAQLFIKSLVRRQTLEDWIFWFSLLIFALVVLFVWSQRLFGFYTTTTVYIDQ